MESSFNTAICEIVRVNFYARHEVGVIVTAAVLRVGNNAITFTTTTAEVVLLEVATLLVEPITIEKIVYHIGRVEELGYGGVDVVFGLHTRAVFAVGPVLEVQDHARATEWTDVVQPLIFARPVFMNKDLRSEHVKSSIPISLGAGDMSYIRGCQKLSHGR